MSVIKRYLTREILKQFGLVLLAVVTIYVVVDFFEKSDNFVKAGLPVSRTLTFFALNTPYIISQIVPIGLLLSIIIVFSLMNKNNELLALKSGGISLLSLVRPVLVLGVVTAVALFFFTDRLVPKATVKANSIWVEEVQKKSLMSSREKNIWIKGNRRITHITYYNPVKQRIYDVSVSFFDDRFRLSRKIDAEEGVFQDGEWLLLDLIEQSRDAATSGYNIAYRKALNLSLDFDPADLAKVVRKPEEMSYTELQAYIRKVEEEGYDATIHKVNLHAKPAFAFVCIIMGFIGTGLAVRKGKNKGIFFSIAYGIAIAFFYWIVHSFCLSLGYGEMLPALISAWVANFIFLILGFLILIYVD